MSIWTRSGKQYIKNTRGPEGMRKLLDFYDYGYDHDENTNVSEFKANDRIMRPVNLGAHDSMLFESGEDYLYRGNNIYECFKEDVKNRTIYAKLTATYKAFYKRAENIFGVNSPMDNLLTERISAEIHYKALQAVDKLIYTLCERYGYQYEKAYSKEWMKCPIVIRTGNKFFQGRLLPYFSHEDVIINHEIRNFDKITEQEPYYVIYLFNRTPAAYRLLDKYIHEEHNNIYPMLFADFIETLFGSEEAEAFEASMARFSDEMQEELGIQTNRLGNEKVFEKLRKTHADKIRHLPYGHIRKRNEREHHNRVKLDGELFSKIKLQFDVNCKVLIGYRNFAISFLTSEWLYGQPSVISEADYTYMVAGYLKSVEQLLWEILLLQQQGKHIGKYNSIIGDENINTQDTTLGAIVRYLQKSDTNVFREDFGDDTDAVKKYVGFYLNQWVQKTRNGYFHKHKLDAEDVQFIREQTYFIYLLILGSLDLSEEHVAQLMS